MPNQAEQDRAQGWRFTYDDSTRFVGMEHPKGGQRSVAQVSQLPYGPIIRDMLNCAGQPASIEVPPRDSLDPWADPLLGADCHALFGYSENSVHTWMQGLPFWERVGVNVRLAGHTYIEGWANVVTWAGGDRHGTLKYFLGIGLPVIALVMGGWWFYHLAGLCS